MKRPSRLVRERLDPNDADAEPAANGDNAIIAFGEALLRTGDLDPVYVAIHGAQLPLPQLKRLLLAYFCFYHLGAAAYLSEREGEDFWRAVEVAARNDQPPRKTDMTLPDGRWPRGAERRHFRGPKCVDAVRTMSLLASPEDVIDSLIEPVPGSDVLPADVVMERVQEWPLFGPWIAWKAADVLERLGLAAIDFPADLELLYKEPRTALAKLGGDPARTLSELINHFRRFRAPPRFERPCNIQEVESIACKHAAHLNGTYFIGKDIKDVRHDLIGWGATAAKLLQHMPPEVTADADADHQQNNIEHADALGDAAEAKQINAGEGVRERLDDAESATDAPAAPEQETEDYNRIPIWLKAGEPDKALDRERLDDNADHQQDNVEPADAGDEIVAPTPVPSNVPVVPVPTTNTDIATVSPEIIEYEDAVIQGKAIVARLDAEWWALCEVLARTKPKYGKQTVKRFFEDIGFPGGERRFNVYGAWRDILPELRPLGPESVPYTVLRVLQSHPDRAELLKSEPTMKKERAVKIMKAYGDKTKATNWRRNRIEKPIKEIADVASRAKHLELQLIQEPGDYQLLLDIVRPRRNLLAAHFRAGGEALLRSAALVENLEQHITDADRQRAAAEAEAASRLGTYRANAAEAVADEEADEATEQQEEATYADSAAQ
jgi:hypothetical protein